VTSSGNVLDVAAEESGQKLLQFLRRRLDVPQAMLHRWIRKGEVRVDGGRSDPFRRLEAGQRVRLPPFARAVAGPGAEMGGAGFAGASSPADAAQVAARAGLTLVGTRGDIWAMAKPSGLAVHPGSGLDDSLAERLQRAAKGAAFLPTPAHRLDRDTSGIVLVAASYGALAELHGWLRDRTLCKEYLAWVEGCWPFGETRTLVHRLWRDPGGLQRMQVVGGKPPMMGMMKTSRASPTRGKDGKARCPAGTAPRHGRDARGIPGRREPDDAMGIPAQDVGGAAPMEARCQAMPLLRKGTGSLLLIRLLTGRRHQLRVQTAATGHPVLGDAAYGKPGQTPPMLLHACRVTLPDGTRFVHLPDWSGPRAVTAIPEGDWSGAMEAVADASPADPED
jgi:23S rRNA pseudouridine955/2504/2580 synthase